jgi:predicted nucleic acid-binding protein
MKRRRLVVDANVVISAFLAEGATRELILDGPFDRFAPQWLEVEVDRTLRRIVHERKIPELAYKGVMEKIMARVQLVPGPLLAQHAKEALRRCVRSGGKDAPYVACALAVEGAIWSSDRRLLEEAGVEVCTTSQLWDEMFG